MSKNVLCDRCGFPLKRGKLPIITPSNVKARSAYCSVGCIEAAAGGQLPEPMRTLHLEVENDADRS